MKYLKIYTGYSTGSFAGRDDGYPEDKLVVYNDLEALAIGYGNHKDERYYEIHEINESLLDEQVKQVFERKLEEKKEQKKQSIKEEIEKLHKQLTDLNYDMW